MSYCEIMKGNAGLVANSSGNLDKIDHLMPMIQGIIYANKPMGLNSLSEFKNMLLLIFGR